MDYFETPYVGGLLPLRAFFRSRRVRQQGRCSIVLPHPPQMSRPLWDSLARGHRFSKWGMCLSYFLAPVSHTRSGLCEMANMADGESEWARPPLREVEPPVAGPNIHPESSLEDGRGARPGLCRPLGFPAPAMAAGERGDRAGTFIGSATNAGATHRRQEREVFKSAPERASPVECPLEILQARAPSALCRLKFQLTSSESEPRPRFGRHPPL